MAKLSDIRSTFLNYFAADGHEMVSSSPLVPLNDPSLMFTTAGMVQFKNTFTGQEVRDYSRAVTSQKCVRAGGKHNDLDNVGYTARHHTFFEMLGNFSFGDYFKAHAIEMAWSLVTKEFGLPKEKLLVTVYHTDDEAFDLWKKIAGLPDEKIIRIATSDNFWAMGDTGPCGPCSEIFYDHGDHIPGGPPGSPDEDGDRFIEIWNLVFMQYEQQDANTRLDLPRPSIDTGMGLERISAVLQGTHDNYKTDLFQALIAASVEETGVKNEGDADFSHRIIADHLRASAFLIADGVLPSNEGRGYVLRRIMRRAMRHAHILGAKDPLMHRLVPSLQNQMGQAFPEIIKTGSLITTTLEQEEIRFRKTLSRGLAILEEESASLKPGDILSGEAAFKLYDTYGFPRDLTQEALRARNISVDEAGFDAAMAKQKEAARAAWKGSGDSATEEIWYDIQDNHGNTEFLGYDNHEAEAKIVAIIKDGESVDLAQKGDQVQIITNQTPFYAESGGQQGDYGLLTTPNAKVVVTDTQKKLGALFSHVAKVEEGSIEVEQNCDLKIDIERRQKLRANHSATHLIHEALRVHLGDHVVQRGSLVEADRLRFDFAQPTAVDLDTLGKAEDLANQMVTQNTEVSTKLMGVDEARALGAQAQFGEKYGDEVRVVGMGNNLDGSTFSLELCGGTHVKNTGEIGLITLINETAVSSGVRRVEALTGDAARHFLNQRSQQISSLAQDFKSTPDQVLERVRQLSDERKKLEKELSEAKQKLAMGGASGGDAIKEINGIKVMARVIEGVDLKSLRPMADSAKQQIESGIVAFVGINEDGDKAGIVVALTSDLTDKYNAVELVKIGGEVMGSGKGGGRPDMAQGAGADVSKAAEAITAIESAIGG